MNFGTLGTGFGGLGRGGAGFAYEAEAITLFAAMSVQPTDARKAVINTLIASLKAAGIWTKLDRLWVTAAHDSGAALINWKNPGTGDLIAVSTPTFTTDKGYAGNGSSSYLRTQFTPSIDGVNYTLNNAAFGVWLDTNNALSANDAGNVGANRSSIIARDASGNLSVRVNNATANSLDIGSITDSTGLSMAQRSAASGAGSIKAFKNGVGAGSGNIASTSLPSIEQWLGGGNSSSFSTRRVNCGFFGAGLVGLELSLDTALRAYMTSVAVV